jgi:hypothetical protein
VRPAGSAEHVNRSDWRVLRVAARVLDEEPARRGHHKNHTLEDRRDSQFTPDSRIAALRQDRTA